MTPLNIYWVVIFTLLWFASVATFIFAMRRGNADLVAVGVGGMIVLGIFLFMCVIPVNVFGWGLTVPN